MQQRESNGGPKRVGMAAIGSTRPRLLILGSLPGEVSLREQRYYGHPRNQFWRILCDVFDAPSGVNSEGRSATDDQRRIALLEKHAITVWDVLDAANRVGSLDTAIRAPEPNDFSGRVFSAPKPPALLFNGQAAHKLFKRHVARPQGINLDTLNITVLPSTSPAYTLAYAKKLETWRQALRA